LSPVDPAGRYTQEVPQYQGMKIWDANSVIVEDLKKSGHLIFHSQITHSYPHNPRSKTPLIFRATPQWFIRMDEPHFPLRKKALEAVEKNIQFVPEWGRQRLQAMIQNTPDWCLSRQRIWGVPIPVFYCTQCEEPLVNEEIMNRVADSFEKDNKGIEAFHETPTDQYTKGFSCTKCGSKEFRKSQDILDVWFDSGVCHTAVQQTRKDLGFPADIYLEGSDQHRGWFQTSLLSSIAAYEQPPFRALITHGFVNDSEGYKMSKSRGNVISPSDVIKKYGAEILRLWVAYEDYGQDVSISEEMFQRITETYRRFRNTIRFMLGNLKDFDFSKHAVPYDRMTSVDQWALFQLNQLILKIRKAFDNYDFYKSYHALNHYFTVTLSSFYLDILKDRLYTAKTEGLPRRSAQTVIFLQLKNLLPLMAPILSFLSEEAYKYLQDPDKKESIFLLPFPEPQEEWDNLKLDERFQELLKLRAEVSKKLEELRKNKTIGSSLEAQVQITVPEHLVQSIQDLKVNLEELFIVSKVTLSPGEKEDILVKKAEGEKCVRCWNYHVEVNKSSQWPGLCPKCIEALS
ncbi:MAG: isoleucine--tRNA ligase, partial [Bdellovibrio sp.]